MADKHDSNDMLHKPDAAFLTQTGRGYLQVGNDEVYTNSSSPAGVVRSMMLTEMVERTER